MKEALNHLHDGCAGLLSSALRRVTSPIPLHTSPRLAKLPGVAGALDKDGYLLQAQP